MLKNVKIATKLYVGFATIILIMLIVGGLARSYLDSVSRSTSDIGANRLPGMTALQDMAIAQLRIGTGIRGLINRRMMETTVRQGNYSEVTDGFAFYNAARNAYEPLPRTKEEDRLWQELQPVFASWQRDIDAIVALEKNKDALLASGIAESDPKVAQLDTQAFEQTLRAAATRKDAVKRLDDLSRLNGDLGKQVVADAAASAGQGNYYILLAILLGLMSGSVIAYTIGRSVTATLETLRQEATKLTQAAVDGRLKTRGDLSVVPTEFQGIVRGINETLDAVITPLSSAADYVDRIAKGQLPPKITDDYRGDFNTLKTNLNQCIEAISQMVEDSQTLSQAAVQGKLSTRAEPTRHHGEYRRIIEGINQTLDAVVDPILEATRVLEALARYDLRARVEGNYQGDHARVKEALNSTGTALHDALAQVAEAVEQVSEASRQIAASSQSVAQGASEQASSLEETSSSLEEMASMTKQNADNTVQARSLAQMTKQAAESGGQAMVRLTDAMHKIRAAAEGTAQIIKDINDIAFQTNLLALNAAVEAARAGDAGRGFAVVAEEVRNLALRSKEAAKKTEDLIRMSVGHAENGQGITSEVGGSLTEIVTAASKVNDIISEIAVASQEQSRGIEQVNTAVSEMDKVVQVAAANAEESSSAAEELSSQSEELSSLVGRFVIERGATVKRPRSASHATPPARPLQQPKRPATSFSRLKAATAERAIPFSEAEEMRAMNSDVTFKDF